MQQDSKNVYLDELLSASELDPLELGDILSCELAEINKNHAFPRLLTLINTSVETVQDMDFTDNPRMADAAMRDIDFLASSLAMMGVVIQEAPGLEQILSQLSVVTDTVPRGTVYTYALQNPIHQERTFTDTPEEHFFIQNVRESGAIMLSQCEELLAINPCADKPDSMAETIACSGDRMKHVVRGIVELSRVITPVFFTSTMRPFFESIEIEGISYAGAGGAQLPLVVIDRLLWGSDNDSAAYRGYYEDNIRYQPHKLRKDLGIAETDAYRISLLGHLRNRKAAGEDMDAVIDEVRGLMNQIKRFRMPHRKIAQDNFKLRPPEAVGSGRYTTSVLDTLIHLTDRAIEETVNLQSSNRVV